MFSLVIPVYSNEENIPRLLEAIDVLNKSINDTFHQKFEAVFVVDGSPDRSFEILSERLPEQSFESQLVLLSRNFGAFSAIRVGLELSQGENFAVMAADLQEPPELMLKFLDELSNDCADVVVGVREDRDDPWFNKLLSNVFWDFYRRSVVKEMPKGGVDIFACNKMFRDHLVRFTEARSSLVAQIFWVGFRRKEVAYSRVKRLEGKSAWSFKKRLDYMFDSVYSFTDLPIKVLTRSGAFGVFISLFLASIIVVGKITGAINVPGYAAIMVMISFFGSLNLIAFGIVGNYAWRTYTNSQMRPLSIIASQKIYIGKS